MFRKDAFAITLRAHRGGGFTKDYLYLSGLKKIYKYYQSGKKLDTLLTGKVSLKYREQILRLQELGLANPITYKNPAYELNNNQNKVLDLILENLK